jgi:hypothetical protein
MKDKDHKKEDEFVPIYEESEILKMVREELKQLRELLGNRDGK